MGWDKNYFCEVGWEQTQATVFIEFKGFPCSMLLRTTVLGNVPLLCPLDRRGNRGAGTYSNLTDSL